MEKHMLITRLQTLAQTNFSFMKILIVGLKHNSQFLRLQEEGVARGHQVDGCLTSELYIEANNEQFSPQVLNLDLSSYDVIYLWALGKRRWEWCTTALFLQKTYGTKIINQKLIDQKYNYFLTPAMDYMKQFSAKLPFPKTAILYSLKTLNKVINNFEFPLIVKPSDGRQGRGVQKAENLTELYSAINALDEDKTPAFVLREFIPNDGDIRVFTVGYKALGAMKRTPKAGDFRSNISQGGSGSLFDLTKHPEVQEIAEKLSKLTQTEIAGVDIILHAKTKKPYILEINPGPQFTGFEQYTGMNAAKEIILYCEKLQKQV